MTDREVFGTVLAFLALFLWGSLATAMCNRELDSRLAFEQATANQDASEILSGAEDRLDPWGTPYQVHEGGSYVRSAGPDKEFGTGDDLTWFAVDAD